MAGGVEVPVAADAHQHLDGCSRQFHLQLHGVKAAVEDHQRHWLLGSKPDQQRTDLAGRDQVAVVRRVKAAHIVGRPAG